MRVSRWGRAAPVQGGVRGRWAAGPLLAVAATALTAAQFAAARPFTALAWLAFAPLLASLLLPPRSTGLLAGWTVMLGLGLALGEGSPAGKLAPRLTVLVLLAAFAVTNSVLRSAAQQRLGQAHAVARVAQSALLREIPQTMASGRLPLIPSQKDTGSSRDRCAIRHMRPADKRLQRPRGGALKQMPALPSDEGNDMSPVPARRLGRGHHTQ